MEHGHDTALFFTLWKPHSAFSTGEHHRGNPTCARHVLGTDRQHLGTCWVQLAGTRVTALDIRPHVRACCWGGNHPAQSSVTGTPGAFFSHNHPSPATPRSWCSYQLLFKTQLNMQWIQENKIWYFCLHSLKAAQGCKIFQKTSLWFSSAERYKTNFTPAVKWCLVMLQPCSLGTKNQTNNKNQNKKPNQTNNKNQNKPKNPPNTEGRSLCSTASSFFYARMSAYKIYSFCGFSC